MLDKNGTIIIGHTRFKAAKSLEMDEVPCVIASDLTDEQIKALRLADNKVGELAEWDEVLLNLELDEILDIDMSDFGFLDEELEETTEKEVDEDDYEEPEDLEPKAKLGDIYQLGRHRLMCGDSTLIDDVEKLMQGKEADMLLTDPPYGIDYNSKNKSLNAVGKGNHVQRDIENDAMNSEDFYKFLYDVFSNAYISIKKGAVFYIWIAETRCLEFGKALKETSLPIREMLVWVKNNFALGRQDYQHKHETCLYGWKEGASHLWASDRKQTTVLEFDKPNKSNLHPTMKPISLFDYQIKNNTKGGDIILDLFSGSGTTIMACEQNGRIAYGMEYDPHYVDVIIDRWEKFTGEKAVLLN